MKLSKNEIKLLKDPQNNWGEVVRKFPIIFNKFEEASGVLKYPPNMIGIWFIGDAPTIYVTKDGGETGGVLYSLLGMIHDDIDDLSPYLRCPLLPTEEERTLFEMEFGFEYPLKPHLKSS